LSADGREFFEGLSCERSLVLGQQMIDVGRIDEIINAAVAIKAAYWLRSCTLSPMH
jgi:hypothetical protein